MSVQGDAVRMRPIFQCLAKESLGCRYTPCSAEVELDRVSLTIHGPVQIHPLTANLDESLVDAPTSAHRPLVALPAFFASLRVAHDPTQDCRWEITTPR